MAHFRFADPFFFLLFIPLLFFFLKKKKDEAGITYSSVALLKTGVHHRYENRSFYLKLMRFLALSFILIALARPQSGKKFSSTLSDGVDIFLAIDTSGSMRAEDFKIGLNAVNRLDAIKHVAEEFVKKRDMDRIGLIVFGDEAYTQCPLTLDHGILLDFFKRTEIGMVGDATAIGQAIATSVARMKNLKSKSKVLILLTDGENTSGEIAPQKAAEIAKTYGIKIYTIGVGSDGMVPIMQNTVFGKRYVYAQIPIDEKTLQEVASITEGRYFRAKDQNQLEEIYEEIDQLEKSKVEVREYTQYREFFYYFVLMAFCLVFLEILLGETIWRKLP